MHYSTGWRPSHLCAKNRHWSLLRATWMLPTSPFLNLISRFRNDSALIHAYHRGPAIPKHVSITESHPSTLINPPATRRNKNNTDRRGETCRRLQFTATCTRVAWLGIEYWPAPASEPASQPATGNLPWCRTHSTVVTSNHHTLRTVCPNTRNDEHTWRSDCYITLTWRLTAATH
jgi:hypothetical protein